MTTSARFIRRRDVLARTTLSHTELYRRIAAGTFPKPIPLGGGQRVAWNERDVIEWIDARIADASESAAK
jgi:prophage regulatory protein